MKKPVVATEWTDFAHDNVPGLYWVRWRARYRVNHWHATTDGYETLCGLGFERYLLYVGHSAARCKHCLREVEKRLTPPEG